LRAHRTERVVRSVRARRNVRRPQCGPDVSVIFPAALPVVCEVCCAHSIVDTVRVTVNKGFRSPSTPSRLVVRFTLDTLLTDWEYHSASVITLQYILDLFTAPGDIAYTPRPRRPSHYYPYYKTSAPPPQALPLAGYSSSRTALLPYSVSRKCCAGRGAPPFAIRHAWARTNT
jgi:hypothetical protein